MNPAFAIRRERHAIGEFSATLNFFQPVSAETLGRVKTAAEKQAERLKLPVPIRQQRFQLALGPNLAQLPTPLPAGYGFHSFAPDGEIDTAILCESAGMVLTLHEYESWQTVHPMVVETLSPIAEEYLAEVPAVRSFAVQYLNEFRSFEPRELSPAELFKNSRWLANVGVDGDQPWHCHTGIFVPRDDRSRFLINVNFDVARTSESEGLSYTLVKVLLLVSLNFDLPGRAPLTVPVGDAREVLSELSDTVHSLEKEILGEILSDDYLTLIGARS